MKYNFIFGRMNYLLALVELSVFWRHRATISATPLSVVESFHNSVRRLKK